MTAVNKMTKGAYAEAIGAQTAATKLANAQTSVDSYQKSYNEEVELAQELRALHVKYVGKSGVYHVENAISELAYKHNDTRRTLESVKTTLAKLTGDAPTDDE
jgi:hypothetical protein